MRLCLIVRKCSAIGAWKLQHKSQTRLTTMPSGIEPGHVVTNGGGTVATAKPTLSKVRCRW